MTSNQINHFTFIKIHAIDSRGHQIQYPVLFERVAEQQIEFAENSLVFNWLNLKNGSQNPHLLNKIRKFLIVQSDAIKNHRILIYSKCNFKYFNVF